MVHELVHHRLGGDEALQVVSVDEVINHGLGGVEEVSWPS